MNPKLYANPFRPARQYVRELPYIEPSFGKHRAQLLEEDLDKQTIEYLAVNRQVLPGFGKHRKNRVNAA